MPITCALVFALAAAPDPAALLAHAEPGLDAVRPEAVSAHIRFLADDLLEGRAPGTRGHAVAELYVAAQLQAAGLEPAGEGGGWFQDVPLRGWKVKDGRLELAGKAGPVALAPGVDYVLASDGASPRVELSAPLAFAGYGVVAPELGWDDLAGVDLRGKIAVVLAGAPGPGPGAFFPPVAHALAADTRAKHERLRERGAVGVLQVWTPDWERRQPWAHYARVVSQGRLVLLDEGRPTLEGLPVRGAISAAAFDRLLAAAGEERRLADLVASVTRLRPARLALRATARVALEAELQDVTARNVLGRLRGSDPALAGEHVLYTAHLDHLGIGQPEGGDAVYNGAMDNAAGVGVLLEAARALARLPTAPRRTVLFAAVTAEEHGLLGSEHLARRPPVPLASIVANVNLDGTPMAGLRNLVAFGADESTLDRPVRAAAAALGLGVVPDPRPEQVILIRSDQWSFIRRGTPAVFPVGHPGGEKGSPEQERAARWWRERYHRAADAWDPTYDYEGMAAFARAMALLGLAIADDPERPRWNPDSRFRRFAAEPTAGGVAPVRTRAGK